MVRMRVVKDHDGHRKGMVLTMSWGEAVMAAVKGWAVPTRRYETQVMETRETR